MTAPGSSQNSDGGTVPIWITYAPVMFVLFWASGFPITRLGLEYIEPFTLLSVRSWLNVAVVLCFAMFVRIRWPSSWGEAGHIAVSGFLLQSAYLGAMFLALGEGVSQGMAALIAGMQPLLTAALVGRAFGEQIRPIQWAGFLLGFGGLVLVLAERVDVGTGTTLGYIAAGATPFLITAGSLYQKRFCAHMDLRSGMIIQHTTAAVTSGIVALAFETNVIVWSGELVFSIVWLVLILSVSAQNLYFIMLRRGEAARVSSLFYLTPPTAVFLGYVTYGETFAPLALAGFAVSAFGVALVTRRAAGS